jgi:lipid-binding SYLF domain-containing protein
MIIIANIIRSGSADIHIADTGLAPAYSYSHSRGLFAGLSLDGSVIVSRFEVNHKFYGKVVNPAELLNGSIPPPRAALPLYNDLADALSSAPDPHYYKPTSSRSSNINRHND